MKNTFKSFTDVLAIFLALLVAVYLVTGYIGIDGTAADGEKLGMLERVEKLLDKDAYRGYFHIFILLVLSAAVGIILRRLPWLSVAVAALTLCFELNLLNTKMLAKYPTGVILFTAAHLAGSIAYAAQCDKEKLTRLSVPLGGLVVGLAGSGFAAYIARLSERVAASADIVTLLRQEAVVISDAVKTLPGAVDRIYMVFSSEGYYSARELAADYLNSLGNTGIRVNFLASIDGTEPEVYAGLAVAFFGAAVLAFLLSGCGSRLCSFVVSCLPTALAAILLINEKLPSGGIMLLAAAVIVAATFAAPMACVDVGVEVSEEDEEDEDEDEDDDDDDDYDDDDDDDVECDGEECAEDSADR